MKNYKFLTIWASLFLMGFLQAGELYVTIYNQNIALVKQRRQFSIDPNTKLLSFKDFAPSIIPNSIELREIDGRNDFRILEQTFRKNIVTADNFLQNYLNHKIQIYLASGEQVSGELLKYSNGTFFLRNDGKIELIQRTPAMRIVVPDSGDSLRTSSLIIWQIKARRKARPRVELSYLTTGLNWDSNYTGILNSDSDKMQLSARISISNNSGAMYKDAKIKLVAGQINLKSERPRQPIRTFSARKSMAEIGMDTGVRERTFSEYHIYQLPRRVTLQKGQMKQIPFFAPATVPVQRRFVYNASRNPKNIQIKISFSNKKSAHLGRALPAGTFRIYKEDDGSLELVGEDRIRHTPDGESVTLTAGTAFDISGKRRVLKRRKTSDRSEEQTVEIQISNYKKKKNVEVKVVERLNRPYWKIKKSSLPYEKSGERQIEFKVPVKRNSTATLTYKVVYSW